MHISQVGGLLVSLKRCASVSAFVLLMVVSARADLIGTSVSGQMLIPGNVFGNFNFFDPANGFVPIGAGNKGGTTVTISAAPAIAFAYADGGLNIVRVSFTDTTITLEEENIPFFINGLAAIDYSFTFPAFSGLILAPISDSFPSGGVPASVLGNVLTLNAPEIINPSPVLPVGSTIEQYQAATVIYDATFSLTGLSPAPVPEPSSAVLLSTILLAAAFGMRKRIAKGL